MEKISSYVIISEKIRGSKVRAFRISLLVRGDWWRKEKTLFRVRGSFFMYRDDCVCETEVICTWTTEDFQRE